MVGNRVDGQGRALIAVQKPSTQVTTNSYDARGRLIDRVDAVGSTAYRYDANNNLTNMVETGKTNVWTFDAYDLIPGFSKLRPFHEEIASLWFFVATHTHLVIRLHHRTTDAEMFILANGCSRIEASAAWVFHLPEITAVGEGNLQLLDVESGFRVICEFARVEDSYEILGPR